MEKTTIFGIERDNAYMREALKLAERAFRANEVPVGSLIVDSEGVIIGRGMNKVEARHSQAAHAECFAIQAAGKKIRDWRLDGCWLYVTLEPCSMCMSLILLSRLAGVVFGASSPLFGFHLDNALSIELYKKGTPLIVKGVCQEQSSTLLKRFFQIKRNHKEVE